MNKIQQKLICILVVTILLCFIFYFGSLIGLSKWTNYSTDGYKSYNICRNATVYCEVLSPAMSSEYLSAIKEINSSNTSSPLLKLQYTNDAPTPYAIFCSSGYKPIGIGNALAIYWTARATAFFMNYSFIMNNHFNNKTTWINADCQQPEFALFDKRANPPPFNAKYKHLQWTWFLPTESHQTIFTTNTYSNQFDARSIANVYNYLWRKYVHSFQSYAVPYHSDLIFVSYNPFFIPIIRNNTRDAFEGYYQYIRSPLYDDIMHQIKEYNVITIHLRTGDILVGTSRQLMNLKYYITAFDMIYAQMDKKKKSKVYVVAQLDYSNAHVTKDIIALNISNMVAYYMVDQFVAYLNDTWGTDAFEVQIIGNDTADNDYFRMVTAPYLICSVSSFCLEAAIANYADTKLIILPWWKRKGFLQMTETNKVIKVKHHKFIKAAKYSVRAGIFNKFQNQTDTERFKKWFIS